MDKGSLRGQYGKTLIDIGSKNKNIVVLDADLAKSTKTIGFGEKFKDRFFDMGLSEQDMISTAAGIALTGKTVFASSFSVFLTGRVFDQVRQSVCYNQANVKLVATHSGLGVGEDGATHQALEDIALMRSLPNMRVIVPADSIETAGVIEYISNEYGPFYVRLTRGDLPIVNDINHKFKLGKSKILTKGNDIVIFAIGSMVEKALKSFEKLKKLSINASVVNLSSIKPLDENTIINLAKETGSVITLEDHSVFGGMGSAVSELLSQECPTKMKIIGIENSFGRSGKSEDLYNYFNLTSERVVKEAKILLGL